MSQVTAAPGGGISSATREIAEKVTPKVIRRLLWFLIMMYIIAFLDRSNIGFAQNEFKADLGMSDAAYALGASLFFIGYAVFEIPSNIIMHKVGAKFWMTRIMVSWGIISALTALVWNEWSFYAIRLLLGVAEAGFFPGVILYLTYWIPKTHMNRARSLFYIGAPLAMIFGSPLSGLIKDVFADVAGLWGWQWMFIIEGLIAVVVGIWAWFYLCNRPREAKFLNQEERDALQAVMDAEAAEKDVEGRRGWAAGLLNGRIWYFAIIYFCIQAAVYGLTFFLPSQVAALTGDSSVGFVVGLFTAIPWICALVGVIYFGRVADRTRKYVPLGAGLLVASAIGIVVSGASGNAVLGLIGLSVAAVGFISIQAFFWSLPTEYMSGVALASGIGLINSLGNLGGFTAPNVRTAAIGWAGGSDIAGLIALACFPLLGAVLIMGVSLFKKKSNDSEPEKVAAS